MHSKTTQSHQDVYIIIFLNIFLGQIFIFIFFALYSTLLHLPPLRFHCADECWDRTQDRCNRTQDRYNRTQDRCIEPMTVAVEPLTVAVHRLHYYYIFLMCTLCENHPNFCNEELLYFPDGGQSGKVYSLFLLVTEVFLQESRNQGRGGGARE
jgi:hypothetical protein